MAKPKQRQMDEFGIAESLGEIKSLHEIDENIIEPEKEITYIDNPEDFRMALGQAQMNGDEFIEVGEKLFKHLLKHSKSKYLTYGDPGVKIYLKGTREALEREAKMTAEQYLEHVNRKTETQQNV